MTSSSGSPSPCSSCSIVMPFTCADAMASRYPAVTRAANAGRWPCSTVGYGDARRMGLFKKKTTDPGEIERLKADIAVMAARLDKSDADKHELGTAVQGIVTR